MKIAKHLYYCFIWRVSSAHSFAYVCVRMCTRHKWIADTFLHEDHWSNKIQ